MHFPLLKDVVKTIYKSGGLAVLAHPGINLKGREDLLPGIVETGIDGLEVYSSNHTKDMTCPPILVPDPELVEI